VHGFNRRGAQALLVWSHPGRVISLRAPALTVPVAVARLLVCTGYIDPGTSGEEGQTMAALEMAPVWLYTHMDFSLSYNGDQVRAAGCTTLGRPTHLN